MFGDAGWPWYNFRSSGIVRFVQGGVVKTFRCATSAIGVGTLIHLGSVVETFHIAERGLAVMLNTRMEDVPNDLRLYIDDPIRVVATDGREQDSIVRGIELRPCLTILLPVDVVPDSVARGDQLFLLRST